MSASLVGSEMCIRDRGGSESSDAGPGSEEVDEGREVEVARDPAAPTDEERKRRERAHVPF
eukprot:14287857-Alexandrium_andersonii.AAC.1